MGLFSLPSFSGASLSRGVLRQQCSTGTYLQSVGGGGGGGGGLLFTTLYCNA